MHSVMLSLRVHHPSAPDTPTLPTRLREGSDLHLRLQAWDKLPTLVMLTTLSTRERQLYALYRVRRTPILCKPLYLQYHHSLMPSTEDHQYRASTPGRTPSVKQDTRPVTS